MGVSAAIWFCYGEQLGVRHRRAGKPAGNSRGHACESTVFILVRKGVN